MQNLEGGSQRGDDPEKSSSTADGAAKPRQKCLTVHDETWARHTHRFVEDYHYRCFRHSWKKCVTWIFLSFTTLCDFDLTSEYLDEITSFVVVNLFFPKYLYSELFIIGKVMTTLLNSSFVIYVGRKNNKFLNLWAIFLKRHLPKNYEKFCLKRSRN